MTIYATHHRLEAKWHLEAVETSPNSVEIIRIWRQDDREGYPMAWRASEESGRTVVSVQIGPPDGQPGLRHPIEGSQVYTVTNPRHIFSYKGEDEVSGKTMETKEQPCPVSIKQIFATQFEPMNDLEYEGFAGVEGEGMIAIIDEHIVVFEPEHDNDYNLQVHSPDGSSWAYTVNIEAEKIT